MQKTEQANVDGESFSAWNPGLRSSIPRPYLPLASIFHPENCSITFETIEERASFTGLDLDEVAVFRPSRHALHSLLIRITANVAVSDGERYEDLGINFRQIAAKLEADYLPAKIAVIEREYANTAQRVQTEISRRLNAVLAPKSEAQPEKPKGLARFFSFGGQPKKTTSPPSREELERQLITSLERDAASANEEETERLCRALHKLLTAISIKHSRIVGDIDTLSEIATGLAMNVLGSRISGKIVEGGFGEAVTAAGFRLLPSQERTVVFNTKGASASGKSTLRPLQRELVERLGLDWREFALISPDIWRKYLLDYDGLGEAWRYAGALAGQELKIVDHKLDLYMATRQTKRRAPHLLIDRFRFDSFTLTADSKGEARLLTRFGDDIYMFFMVTPPEELVERAWLRGLEVGRFKALDDLLDHCIEAYTGMPPLFFRWATHRSKRVRYEILDNDVPKGRRPLTIAFGRGGDLVILSLKGMGNIDRFRSVNVDAASPSNLYRTKTADWAFLRQCADRMSRLIFAEPETGTVAAVFESNDWSIIDVDALARLRADSDQAEALDRLGCPTSDGENGRFDGSLEAIGEGTLGQWGQARSAEAPGAYGVTPD